jgi:hypothetical protein
MVNIMALRFASIMVFKWTFSTKQELVTFRPLGEKINEQSFPTSFWATISMGLFSSTSSDIFEFFIFEKEGLNQWI